MEAFELYRFFLGVLYIIKRFNISLIFWWKVIVTIILNIQVFPEDEILREFVQIFPPRTFSFDSSSVFHSNDERVPSTEFNSRVQLITHEPKRRLDKLYSTNYQTAKLPRDQAVRTLPSSGCKYISKPRETAFSTIEREAEYFRDREKELFEQRRCWTRARFVAVPPVFAARFAHPSPWLLFIGISLKAVRHGEMPCLRRTALFP